MSDLKVSGTTTRKSFKINALYKVSESFTVNYDLTFVVSESIHPIWIYPSILNLVAQLIVIYCPLAFLFLFVLDDRH